LNDGFHSFKNNNNNNLRSNPLINNQYVELNSIPVLGSRLVFWAGTLVMVRTKDLKENGEVKHDLRTNKAKLRIPNQDKEEEGKMRGEKSINNNYNLKFKKK
jgi:hypothetical protein